MLLYGKAGWADEAVVPAIPEGRLSLYNLHTDERLTVVFRGKSGEYDAQALQALNHILRCHYTNQVGTMDVRVLEFLNAVDHQLGGGHEMHIVSGYRSHEYNDLLIRKGSGVAKESLHLSGRAVDIQIPGIEPSLVRHTALALRFGGVGYYPVSGFVHLDSGRVRWW
jgi:uncharacterized protein YcbK (DUF882 family)